jgi:hypothetical protein
MLPGYSGYCTLFCGYQGHMDQTERQNWHDGFTGQCVGSHGSATAVREATAEIQGVAQAKQGLLYKDHLFSPPERSGSATVANHSRFVAVITGSSVMGRGSVSPAQHSSTLLDPFIGYRSYEFLGAISLFAQYRHCARFGLGSPCGSHASIPCANGRALMIFAGRLTQCALQSLA